MPFTLLEGALGGIGLFLFGIRLMSDGIRTVVDSRIRNVFKKITQNRLLSFSSGILLAILVQSGSAAVVFAFALLHSRIINSFQTLNILAGILLGASIALQIHIPGYTLIAPFLIFAGILINLFAHQRRFFNLGKLLLGIGILFLGLSLLEGSYRAVDHHPLYEVFDGFFYRTTVSASFFGVLLSFLVQSATTFTTIISSLIPIYSISMDAGFCMVAAGVSGAAILGCLAAAGLGAVSRRLAAIFLLITFTAGVLALPLWHYLFAVVPNPNFDISILYSQLSRLHLLTSCLAAAILLACSSFVSRFMALLEKNVLASNELASHSNGYLDERIIKTPTIALEQARKEIIRMMTVTSFMYADLRSTIQNYDSRRAETIRQHEHLLDSLNHEITAFLARLSQDGSSEIKYEIAFQLHTVSGLEHIGDRCEEILKSIESKKEAGVIFSDAAMSDIQTLAVVVSDVLGVLEDVVINGSLYDKDRLLNSKKMTRNHFNDVKRNHFLRISDGVCSTRAMMYFNDIMAAFMRITEDCWSVLEDRTRKQL